MEEKTKHLERIMIVQIGEVRGRSEVKNKIVFGKRDLYLQSHRAQNAHGRMACGK